MGLVEIRISPIAAAVELTRKRRPSQAGYSAGGPREEVVPFTKVRKLIAENMLRSKHNAAHTHCFDETDMSAIVNDIAALLRPELEQRGIALRLDLATDGVVRIDRHQFEQVVLNILRNAMESIGSNGAIGVIWRDRVLAVRDTGPGIDETRRGELFTPFFTTRRDGRGLGLTIVGDILTNHRAYFSLQNRAEGGAEFRIIFNSP